MSEMTLKLNTYILSIALLGLLTSCGTSTQANGGMGGTGMTVGTVSSYGSIFVNGIEFNTDNVTVTLDGVTYLDDSEIDIGMVVSVEGSVNADGLTGTANTVTFRDELEGPLSANNVVVDGTITVLGQVVTINSQTVYEPGISGYLTLAAIPGDGSVVVEVSGYPDGRGNVYATRIEVKSPGDSEIEVKGIVIQLPADADNFLFKLGELTVYYGEATGGELVQDGSYVQVHSSAGVIGGKLIASGIEGNMSVEGSEGDEFDIEGTVTSILINGEFSLNGQLIRIDGSTEMDEGVLVALDSFGSVVEVEGTLVFEGNDFVIVADEIEVREVASIHIAAQVTGFDAVASTVILLGLPVQITRLTVITDETDMIDVWPLQVVDMYGLYLEVEVARDAGDNLVAVRLEVENPPSDPQEVELEGVISSVPLSPLEVEGVPVDIDTNGLSLGGATEGDELSVTGTWDGSTLTATTIE
jgi:hypothetical protein